MKRNFSIGLKKFFVAILLVCVTQIALGSFTGTSDCRTNSVFSLKNFNKNFFKNYSSFSLRSGFTFKGFQVTDRKKESNGDITLNTIMRYEKGNITYLYPSKRKILLSKFKTPEALSFR